MQSSAIKHLKAHGGSGDDIDGMRFVGMLSIHNTSDISIDNVHLKKNYVHDDMMHIVYVSNLKMIDSGHYLSSLGLTHKQCASCHRAHSFF